MDSTKTEGWVLRLDSTILLCRAPTARREPISSPYIDFYNRLGVRNAHVSGQGVEVSLVRPFIALYIRVLSCRFTRWRTLSQLSRDSMLVGWARAGHWRICSDYRGQKLRKYCWHSIKLRENKNVNIFMIVVGKDVTDEELKAITGGFSTRGYWKCRDLTNAVAKIQNTCEKKVVI